MQPMSAIVTICMLTSLIKCLLSIPEQRLVSSHTKYRVTRRSNASILIKHIVVARIPRSPRAHAITPVQYRVILHGTGIGKYCCRNINWIINLHTVCVSLSVSQKLLSPCNKELSTLYKIVA